MFLKFLALSIEKKIVKFQAPDVRLTRWLLHSAYFFETKSSSILLMVKSSQIIVFCHFEAINRLKETRFFKVEAARRATGTKLTFVYFQKKSWFFKAGAARRATGTKLTFVYFQKNIFLNSGCFITFWPLGPRLFFGFLASGCFKILGPQLY